MNKNNFYTNLKSQTQTEFLDLFGFDFQVKNGRYSEHFRANKQYYNNYIFLLKQVLSKSIDLHAFSKEKNKIAHSNAYFNPGNSNQSEYTFIPLPWMKMNEINLFIELIRYRTRLEKLQTKDLISNDLSRELHYIESQLTTYYSKNLNSIVCLSNDLHFYERLTIKIAKKLDIPSFLFNHGLPAIYNVEIDNRADYRVVWGNAVKQNYINAGFEKDKIFVSGHPIYSKIKKPIGQLKSSLNNILVITKNLWWGTPFSNNIYSDRSQLLNYLLQIEITLKELGVQKARFRVHPSENLSWYLQNVNNQFYIPDKISDLNKSLAKTSLVIGPTSTVLIDSYFSNVNYIIFEPLDDRGLNYSGLPLVPPFDGSDKRISVSNTKEELKENLKNNRLISENLISDYIQSDYNISFLNDIKQV